MRADIGEDATITRAFEKPVGALVFADAVRAEACGVDHFANRAGLYQFAGFDGRALVVMLGIKNGVNLFGLRLNAAHLFKFAERHQSRFVAHEILAVPHDFKADLRTISRNGRRQDQFDVFVFQNAAFVRNAGCHWKFFAESQGHRIVGAIKGFERAACTKHGLDLSLDMIVIDADSGE